MQLFIFLVIFYMDTQASMLIRKSDEESSSTVSFVLGLNMQRYR